MQLAHTALVVLAISIMFVGTFFEQRAVKEASAEVGNDRSKIKEKIENTPKLLAIRNRGAYFYIAGWVLFLSNFLF